MLGHEVNEIMKPESRAELDEEKSLTHLSVKLNIFDVAFHNLEASMVHESTEKDNFKWIPFPCGLFVDILIESFFVLGQDRSKKFLDVGCGIGTKVALASVLFDAYGIDYNSDYIDKAQSWGINRVALADALEFDNYNQFDFIYYYRPISDSSLYRKFELKVYEEMKVGAVVAPMHTELNWQDIASGMEQVSQFLCRKVK